MLHLIVCMFTVPTPRYPTGFKETRGSSQRGRIRPSRSPPLGQRGSHPHHGVRCRLFWYVNTTEVTIAVNPVRVQSTQFCARPRVPKMIA